MCQFFSGQHENDSSWYYGIGKQFEIVLKLEKSVLEILGSKIVPHSLFNLIRFVSLTFSDRFGRNNREKY